MKKKTIAGLVGTIGIVAVVIYAAIAIGKVIADDETFFADFDED